MTDSICERLRAPIRNLGGERINHIIRRVRLLQFEAARKVEELDEENSRLRQTLSWYADQFCEHSRSNEGCGKFGDDVCAGCKARGALDKERVQDVVKKAST